MVKTKFVIKGFINNENVYFIRMDKGSMFGVDDWDVRQCTRSIDYATLYNSVEEAEEAIQNIQSDKFKIYPVCPICGEDYSGHPAISRKDNKSKICPNCGTGEAFMDFIKNYKLSRID